VPLIAPGFRIRWELRRVKTGQQCHGGCLRRSSCRAVGISGGCMHTMCSELPVQKQSGLSMIFVGRHPSWGTRPPPDQAVPSIALKKPRVGGIFASRRLWRVCTIDGYVGEEQIRILPRPDGSSPSQWLVLSRWVATDACRKAKLEATPLEFFGH